MSLFALQEMIDTGESKCFPNGVIERIIAEKKERQEISAARVAKAKLSFDALPKNPLVQALDDALIRVKALTGDAQQNLSDFSSGKIGQDEMKIRVAELNPKMKAALAEMKAAQNACRGKTAKKA